LEGRLALWLPEKGMGAAWDLINDCAYLPRMHLGGHCLLEVHSVGLGCFCLRNHFVRDATLANPKTYLLPC